jgi:hypothetical protein
VVRLGAAGRNEAQHPAMNLQTFQHRSMPDTQIDNSSHEDGEHKGMAYPGASHRRGAAVLRHEGQHSGKFLRRRVSMPLMHHKKETKVGEREERRRLSHFG